MLSRLSFIFLILLVVVLKINAQKSHGAPEDFKEALKRPLLVELLQEDPKIVRYLEKHLHKHPTGVEDYKSIVELYNSNIRMVVKKFWTASSEIDFKYAPEIKFIISDKKSIEYSCLYYSESSEQFIDYVNQKNLVVPTLNFTRLEHYHKNVDYSIFLPISFLKPHDDYVETDLIFGVQFIQRNIEYMIKNNKKMTASTYAKTFGVTCSLLKDKTLLVDKHVMDDSTSINEIKKSYKYKFAIADAQKINAAVENTDDETAYLVSLPYEKHVASPNSPSQILCIRLVIDSKDGNILSSIGTSIRESKPNVFLTQDFAVCDTCE